VVEKADVKALLGNYLSGGKLRRDRDKVNQEQKSPREEAI
tara:strand:+ start:3822 stop:3941 length:120 start_codon:yes stop_codon:yes gene_type:complete